MTYEEKEKKLMAHIGWQQVSDIKAIDAECEVKTTKKSLAIGLIENAQNQTGISLEDSEHKILYKKVYARYS